MLALLAGYDLLIVLGIIALLFGSSQLPKLARSLGSASSEFKKGTEEGGGKSPREDLKAGAANASTDLKQALAEAKATPTAAPLSPDQVARTRAEAAQAQAEAVQAQAEAVQAQARAAQARAEAAEAQARAAQARVEAAEPEAS